MLTSRQRFLKALKKEISYRAAHNFAGKKSYLHQERLGNIYFRKVKK